MATGFDFDEMAHLAKHDTVAFEARRRALLHEALSALPPARRVKAQAALDAQSAAIAKATGPSEKLVAAALHMKSALEQMGQGHAKLAYIPTSSGMLIRPSAVELYTRNSP